MQNIRKLLRYFIFPCFSNVRDSAERCPKNCRVNKQISLQIETIFKNIFLVNNRSIWVSVRLSAVRSWKLIQIHVVKIRQAKDRKVISKFTKLFQPKFVKSLFGSSNCICEKFQFSESKDLLWYGMCCKQSHGHLNKMLRQRENIFRNWWGFLFGPQFWWLSFYWTTCC